MEVNENGIDIKEYEYKFKTDDDYMFICRAYIDKFTVINKDCFKDDNASPFKEVGSIKIRVEEYKKSDEEEDTYSFICETVATYKLNNLDPSEDNIKDCSARFAMHINNNKPVKEFDMHL